MFEYVEMFTGVCQYDTKYFWMEYFKKKIPNDFLLELLKSISSLKHKQLKKYLRPNEMKSG